MFKNSLAMCMACILLCAFIPGPVFAQTQEQLELKNTILNLIDELVEQGVIAAEKAQEMKDRAAMEAREQAAREVIDAGEAVEALEAEAPPATADGQPVDPTVIRVPYVPEYVKDEIREELREEMAADVTEDVIAVAREEKWGTPDALPGWMSKVTMFGDMRLRYLGGYTDETNFTQVPNFQSINDAGGAGLAGADAFLNTTEDIDRGQVRLRVGLFAQVSDRFGMGVRLATGNDTNPISRNQTLGDYNSSWDIVIDHAYLQFATLGYGDDEGHNLRLRGGRLPNPFFYSPILWDSDLTLDALTAEYDGPLYGPVRWFTNLGYIFLLGEEANRAESSTDKKNFWGGQFGLDFDIGERVDLKLAGAWYDFNDITGELNDFESNSKDWTAPAFIVKGNTVFDIRNDLDPNTNLFALASEFELLNLSAELDFSFDENIHVILTGDYVENMGFDVDDVSARVGETVNEKNKGWFTNLQVGWPKTIRRGSWNIFGGYRYLERDAVVDAFSDSDFHAGGTDAKGWHAGINYGVANNVWLRARYLSADDIDGAPAGFVDNDNEPVEFTPLAIDILQVDLNAKF